MASALRSSVLLALRRAAPSRLSSAGAASANTRVVPANPELDKADSLFTAAAFVGMALFGCLVDGEGVVHYFGWCKEGNARRQPRMTSRRSRC